MVVHPHVHCNLRRSQGSVLCFMLLYIYMRLIESILLKHNISYHFHADDTQLHLLFDHNDSSIAVNTLNNVVADIRSWMPAHFLKLNADKTKLILIGILKRVDKFQHLELNLGVSVVRPSASARNLGVIFADTLSFKQFCLKSASAATFHIRSLSKIRDHLFRDLTSRLCTSFVPIIHTNLTVCRAGKAGERP